MPTSSPHQHPARLLLALALLLGAAPAGAEQTAEFPLHGTARVAFPPADDAASLVIEAVGGARHQVLVQAYTFTHRRIAEALIAALRRGVDVRVIADPRQDENVSTSLLRLLDEQGIRVYLDGQHVAAHDKVMVIDADDPAATLITGSFNFTHAAQYRNAENLLVLRGDRPLVSAYADNWHRHRRHSPPYRR